MLNCHVTGAAAAAECCRVLLRVATLYATVAMPWLLHLVAQLLPSQ